MNIVSFALRRPISLLVAVAAIVLAALLALHRMPRDIFPDLGVPTIYVAQTYGGLDPAQMEGFIVNYYEYHFLYISGIEHIESKSIQGVALIKLQFHPGTNMAEAMAETVSYVDRSRAFMPPGTLPPFVLRFDAGSVPVGDLVFSSKTRSIGELQDAALFRVRPLFATLPGVSAPPPFGSSQRSIVINADPERLRAYNMSPEELVRALGSGNIISPSGNVPIGDFWPMVPVNTVVSNIKELNDIPIRLEGPKTVFLRDVGSVEDSTDIQTSYALVDGRRTVYIPVTKRADASTLAVVGLVRQNLTRFQAVLPDDIRVSYEFDQSAYVTRAIYGLLFEGGIGAVLTGLMVLLFLRDWRSALIVVLNIPLAVLSASLALWVSDQTVNIMTLGGLALAVGILVDEATVTIENVHTHLARGRGLARAARDATVETTLPRFLAMVSILAVFIPAFFMTGAARNLFVPLSLAVGFSMVGSFLLSSTLVPVLCVWSLRAEPGHDRPCGEQGGPETAQPPNPQDLPSPAVGAEVPATDGGAHAAPDAAAPHGPQQPPAPAGEAAEVPATGGGAHADPDAAEPHGPQPPPAPSVETPATEGGTHADPEAAAPHDPQQPPARAGEASATSEPAFERFRRRYARLTSSVIAWRRVVILSYLAICGLLVAIVGASLGTEIFPVVDTGQFQLRLRAQPGTRIDRTEQIALQALEAIKHEVGPENVAISLGFVGTQPPNFAINTIYLWSSGSEEAILQIQLKRDTQIRVEELKEKLRRKLPQELPGVRFSFERSDIVSRVMSFGAPTPIEVAVSGTDITEIRRYAEKLERILAKAPMLRDQAFGQELDYPIIKVDFIRELAGILGLTAEDVANALVPATSSSRYTLPNYWADPKSGVGYQVQVEIPGPRINSLEEVRIVPIARRDGKQVAVRDLATVSKGTTFGEYDRYNMQRMLTLSANIAGEDLGGAARTVRRAIDSAGQPPKAVTVTVRGQVRPMEGMFDGLRWGLLVAIGAILLLLTAYFQSFRLSTAVILTVPAVVAGAVVMLWLTHTTLNIQSFMGTIMAVGVAVANSILLVTFAERSRLEGREASAAAIDGASSRLRPIVMTGAAMIAGMIPMALGLSEGGEQTAPLARAVIGGLSGSMCATLLVLPAIFTMLTLRSSRASASLDPEDPQSSHFDAHDVHATEGGHDSGRIESKTPVGPGPGEPSPAEPGPQDRESLVLPAIVPDQAIASIKSGIDISERARIDTFGHQAQRAVADLTDRILTQAQSRELGTTGSLLLDILAKARRLDPAAIKDGSLLRRMFSSLEARVRRLSRQFGTVASQIDRITIDLDRNEDVLRRDIALLDELHEQTRTAIASLDAHIAAGKAFVEEFRAGRLAELEASARSPPAGSDAMMAAQTHLDAVLALDRLEKRILYLQQARQIGIQQLPQIRIVQSGDETMIENLLATTELTIPAWKQKMILLLGITRQQSALELQKTVTGATDEMMCQTSEMMKAQSIGIEMQSQGDDPPVGAGDVHVTDDDCGSDQGEADPPADPAPEDSQNVAAEAPDLRATDDGHDSEHVGRDTAAAFGTEDQQSAHDEAPDLQAASDDRDSEQVEREPPPPHGLQDQQNLPLETPDLRATNDERSGEQVDTPAPPGPEGPQGPPVEGRDSQATDHDRSGEPGDHDETG